MNPAQCAVACALLALQCGSARATEAVWRCGGNSYSSQPCSDGRQLEIAPAPSAEAHRQALAVAEQERRLAATMTQQRRQRERDLRVAMGSGLTGIERPASPTGAGAGMGIKPGASSRLPDQKKQQKAKQGKPPRSAQAPKQRPPRV